MIDFTRVDNDTFKLSDLQEEVTHQQLIDTTNHMIDTMLAMVQDVPDDYVTFQPLDPDAHDPVAATQSEENIAWTLGHVIVHATASGEETAALGATLARGIEVTWRSRYEVPWETMQTTRQLIERLEDSRRMRLSFLNAWANPPNLDVTWNKLAHRFGKLNAIGYTLLGLKHDHDHLEQIQEIIRQAQAAEKVSE